MEIVIDVLGLKGQKVKFSKLIEEIQNLQVKATEYEDMMRGLVKESIKESIRKETDIPKDENYIANLLEQDGHKIVTK